jgi:hypothetical protein
MILSVSTATNYTRSENGAKFKSDPEFKENIELL